MHAHPLNRPPPARRRLEEIQVQEAQPGPPPEAHPFPGLRPFESAEAHLFFGRDGQSDELLRRLERTRFLAVVGSSGSGKSSLVRAGLLPSLQGGSMTSAGSRWRIAVMRPGSDPVGNLAAALGSSDVLGTMDADSGASQKLLESGLRRSSRGVIGVTRRADLDTHTNLLIVVDQFEELFRFKRLTKEAESPEQTGDSAAAAFVKLLLEGAGQREVPIYVVLTMRSDFLGDCAQFRDLPEALNDSQYLIPRMTRDQRREAIEGPIAVGGAQATRRLVQRLLNDLGDNPDQLPVLQHALMRTWDNWRRRGTPDQPLDLPDYEAIGTMSSALSKHADEIYDGLPDDESKRVAGIVFKCLTERGPDNREVRRPTRLDEVQAVAGRDGGRVTAVVERFRGEGVCFLMPPASVSLHSDSVIDISHESLIRLWKRLGVWVEEEAQSAATYLRLAEAAGLHSKGAVALWRPPELDLALHWKERQEPHAAWAKRYDTQLERALAFLEKSRRARTRRHIFRGVVTLSLFVLSVAFGVTKYWAVEQQERLTRQATAQAQDAQSARALAEHREKEAIARQLVAESSAQHRLDTSLLLRATAQLFDRSFRERATLLGALQEHPAVIALLTPGDREVVDAAFSPAGDALATLSADGSVVLWDVRTRRRDGEPLRVQKLDATSMAYSPDGKRLAVGSREGRAVIWNTDTRALMGEPLQAGADLTSLAFTPDAKVLAAGSEDGSVWLWRLADPRQPAIRLAGRQGKVMSIAISPSGELLAAGGDDGRIALWNLPARRSQGAMLQGHRGIVSSLSFSHDGRLLASGGVDHRVVVWDLKTRKPRGQPLAAHRDEVVSVAFGRNHALATGGKDQTLLLWDLSDGSRAPPAPRQLDGHRGAITRVAFSRDGKLVATSSRDGTAILWDVSKRMRFGDVLAGHAGPLASVAFSPDGKLAAGGGRDDLLTIWDAKTKEPIHREVKAGQEWINALAFSPDGSKLATAGNDATVVVWDAATATPVGHRLRGHSGSVTSLAFSSDGNLLATGSADKTVRIWDAHSGESIGAPLQGHREGVQAIAFNADGKLLASGSTDAAIILWDVTTRTALGEPLRAQREAITSIAFSPRQDRFATGSADQTVALWDVGSRKPSGAALFGHSGPVTSVAFTSDGKMLASGSSDNTVRLWDVDTRRAYGPALQAPGDPNRRIGGIQFGVSTIAFSPDGRKLLAGGWSPAAVLWDIDLTSWLQKACEIANRNLTHAEWTQFLREKDYEKACPALPDPEDADPTFHAG